MKKNVFALMMVGCLAFFGVAQAQEQITLTVNESTNSVISMAKDPITLSYAPEPVEVAGFAGLGGMAFDWGYMFPANMIQEYAGKYLTHVAYVDGGDESVAGTSYVHVWLGGDAAPESLACSQKFEVTGTIGDIVVLPLDEPVLIDGTQNLWVTLYQDGTVQGPACLMPDMGDPNSRWIGIESFNMWMDMASAQGGEGYGFLLWAFVEEYDALGELESNVAVYPSVTSGDVNVVAPDMSRVTVVNILGQEMYDEPVNGDTTVIDMGKFKGGIYLVLVTTKSGVTVKRVTVTK